jgi:hypothetical protein
MNNFSNKLLKTRCAAVCAAALTVLAACGGGGSDPSQPGPGSVTDAQAFRVTSASIAGGPMSLLVPADVLLSAISGLTDPAVNGYATGQLDISSACTAAGGTMIMTINDLNDNGRGQVSDGDIVSLDFANCAVSSDGVSQILTGGIDMTSRSTVRSTDTVNVLTFTPRTLSATVRGVAATYNGSLGIETVFANSNSQVLSSAYITNLLEINFAGGRTDRITNARWGYGADASSVRLSPNQTVTLIDNNVATTFSVATTVPWAFRNSDSVLTAGELSILHPSDVLRSRVSSAGNLEIAIDYNSGGLFDRFLNINALDLLNGWN